MENNEMNIKSFKRALHEGKVEFKYTKKNGEERSAIGYETSDTTIRYYDLNSEGWRSFVVDNLIEWKSVN